MTKDSCKEPNFKSSPMLRLPTWAVEAGISEAEFLKLPIEQHIASELVTSQFLKFCYRCGAAITFRPNKKKGNGPHWLKMEYLQPDLEHVCGTKKRSISEIVVIDQDEKEQATP